MGGEHAAELLRTSSLRHQYVAYCLICCALAFGAEVHLLYADSTSSAVPWADVVWLMLSLATDYEVVSSLQVAGLLACFQDPWWLSDLALVVTMQIAYGAMAFPLISARLGSKLQHFTLTLLAVRFGCRCSRAMPLFLGGRRLCEKRQVSFVATSRRGHHESVARSAEDAAPSLGGGQRGAASGAGRPRHTSIEFEAASDSDAGDIEWVCINCGMVNQDLLTHCTSCGSVRLY